MDEHKIDFQSLKDKTFEELMALGMRNWDDHLCLFPKEWYDDIPEGLEVIDISGKAEKFEKGRTDDDSRWGALAFGILPADRELKAKSPSEDIL